MNNLIYYDRQKENWDEHENTQIKHEYEKEMSISEIADIHRRTPGSICYKLKHLGIISDTTSAKGYLEYKNSKLYQEVIQKNKILEAENKIKSQAKNAMKKTIPLKNNYTSEIQELRSEIYTLKTDVKEMLRLMNALYEFESVK